jgi:chloride channel protein, CIC family
LLLATVVAHGFTVLVLKRSILTEKVSRRGFHLTREYAVDPLEILFVREVMRTNLVAFGARNMLDEVVPNFRKSHGPKGQHLYPIVGERRELVGVITRKHMQKLAEGGWSHGVAMEELARKNVVVAHPDEPLRAIVYRMAETGVTRMPVVEPGEHGALLGMVSLQDLLGARARNLTEERNRERVLKVRLPVRAFTNKSVE